MGRLLLALLVGLVGALIVHIGVIFSMPRVAEDNAWARLTRIMPGLRPTLLAGSSGTAAPSGDPAQPMPQFGFTDPAFLMAACRFAVSDDPVRLVADEAGAGFWSASVHARSGEDVYSINERLAPRARLDLVVGTRDQLDAARLEGLMGEEDSIPVEVASGDFYVTLRALVESESERPLADRFVRSLSCDRIELEATRALSVDPG